ncbi:pathogenesis-related protein PR-1-like [Carya illinoinensis]|uniref:SCP domain-containing protein n=1 Tax=Carya illinoinensis TaxID=32201 RepID=A0A8T1PSF0_CARIL|nr:pathogenesis-related protein PR-1-like [Carya illinoinensis]KAG6644177.1 hypothetical protein CIPAW_08G037600 [Carya illinoinensis]
MCLCTCKLLSHPALMKSVMKPSEFLQMRMYLCTVTTIFLGLLISSTHAVTKQGQYPSLANQFLAPHNAARSSLRLRPLMWDPKLARYARWYANQRRFDCALRHSNGPYGENIFWGIGNGWTPSQAVTAWVSERKWYNYRSNSCASGQMCGHFTQIVWRTTRRVGCARVICSGGRGVFMTCNYDPPGNYIGERPY